MRMFLGLAVALLVGCGGSEEEGLEDGTGGSSGGQTQKCGSMTGTYKIHYTLRSGNCGAIPDYTTYISSSDGAGCTAVSSKLSTDLCTISYVDFTCPPSDGVKTWSSGFLTSTLSGKSASGTMTFELYNSSSSAYICSGTYDLTYTKQ